MMCHKFKHQNKPAIKQNLRNPHTDSLKLKQNVSDLQFAILRKSTRKLSGSRCKNKNICKQLGETKQQAAYLQFSALTDENSNIATPVVAITHSRKVSLHPSSALIKHALSVRKKAG